MREPRARFPLWMLLLAVAAIAAALGVGRRWSGFRERAGSHERESLQYQLMAQDGVARHRRDDPEEEARLKASEEARGRDRRAKSAHHSRMARHFLSRW